MANERIPFSVTPTSVIIMMNGKTYTLTEDSHINYAKIREALKTKDFDTVRELIDVAQSINVFGNGKIKVVNGTVMYGDVELHNALTERLVQQMEEGFDVDPMVKFLENLMQNPSKRAVDELYRFLEHNSLPITEDGHFVAYKRVKSDYTDFYTGKMDNSIGSTPEMPRNMVDDDKDRTCSQGLHFCSLEYLPHYHSGQGRIVILKINPADVVSIPTDYNNAKGRACKYLVLEDYEGDETTEKFTSSVYETGDDANTSSEWDSEWYADLYASSSSEMFDGDYVVCWSCNHELTEDQLAENDGLCPACHAEIEDDEDKATVNVQAPVSTTAQSGTPAAQAQHAAQNTPPQGILYTKEQAAKLLNISADALRKRLARGVSVQLVVVNGAELVRIL
jgi:hypothetical protein